MTKTKRTYRALAMLFMLVMLCSLLPTMAFAVDVNDPSGSFPLDEGTSYFELTRLSSSTNDNVVPTYIWQYDGSIYVALNCHKNVSIGTWKFNDTSVSDYWLLGENEALELYNGTDEENPLYTFEPGQNRVWLIGETSVQGNTITFDFQNEQNSGGWRVRDARYLISGDLNVSHVYGSDTVFDLEQSEIAGLNGLKIGERTISPVAREGYNFTSVSIKIDGRRLHSSQYEVDDSGNLTFTVTEARKDSSIDIVYNYSKILDTSTIKFIIVNGTWKNLNLGTGDAVLSEDNTTVTFTATEWDGDGYVYQCGGSMENMLRAVLSGSGASGYIDADEGFTLDGITSQDWQVQSGGLTTYPKTTYPAAANDQLRKIADNVHGFDDNYRNGDGTVGFSANTVYILTLTKRNYTVTFMNGATELSKKTDYSFNDTVTVPSDPTKDPTDQYTYTFSGWDTDSSADTVVYTSTNIPKVTADATYYAVFSRSTNTYDVIGSIDNGGTVTNSSQLDVPYGDDSLAMVFTPAANYRISSVTVNDVELESYTLTDGRYTYPAQTVTGDITVVVTTVLDTAGYTVNYYKDSIDTNNLLGSDTGEGTIGEDIPYTDGKYLPEGYKTPGAVSGATVIGATSSANVLNIVYSKDTYTITYKIVGTYLTNNAYKVIPDVPYDTSLQLIADDMTRKGYTFSGWTGLPEKMPARDIEVTGYYTLDQLIIQLDDPIDGEYLVTKDLTVEVASGSAFAGEKFGVVLVGTNGPTVAKAVRSDAAVRYLGETDLMDATDTEQFKFGPNGVLIFDAAGTYTYSVNENAGDTFGMRYDTNTHTLTIVVAEGEEGLYIASVDTVTVTNVYKTPSYTIQLPEIIKNITVKHKNPANTTFSFALYADADCTKQIGNAVTLSCTGIKDGSKYELQDAVVEYYAHSPYTTLYLKEVAGRDRNWTYDDTVYTLSLVGGSDEGTYTAVITAVDGEGLSDMLDGGAPNAVIAASFNNIYTKKNRSESVTPKPTKLNTEDHYAYIIGYEDGQVKPNNNITRAEVATIFFRLLNDDVRDEYWTQINPYSDVSASDWYNNAISVLSNMGIITGYPDGTFQPNGKITRAEFTAIAARFFEVVDIDYQADFSDVPASAWFAEYVNIAAYLELVTGYPDGTFRPNNYITRAEACTIVNRTLGREPDEDHLLPLRMMVTWADNKKGDWYYAQIQEATNSHDYIWINADGEEVYKGEEKTIVCEQWTVKLDEREWAALEREWSNAYFAPGGEVMN